jgi:hypothetical protein
MHVRSQWDSELHALLFRNPYNGDFGKHVAFAAVSPAAASFTADRAIFLGTRDLHSVPPRSDANRYPAESARAWTLAPFYKCASNSSPEQVVRSFLDSWTELDGVRLEGTSIPLADHSRPF